MLCVLLPAISSLTCDLGQGDVIVDNGAITCNGNPQTPEASINIRGNGAHSITVTDTPDIELGFNGAEMSDIVSFTATDSTVNLNFVGANILNTGITCGNNTNLRISGPFRSVLTVESSTGSAIGSSSVPDERCNRIEIENLVINATSTLIYGAGIGSYVAPIGDIEIRNAVVTATGGWHCAGIGGCANATATVDGIVIEKSTVTALSKNGNTMIWEWGVGAGIGGGENGRAGNITIRHSTVTSSSANAAGIGGGYNSISNVTRLLIEDSNISARSQLHAAAIGGGHFGGVSQIIIWHSDVHTLSEGLDGSTTPGIGCGAWSNVYSIVIDNSRVVAKSERGFAIGDSSPRQARYLCIHRSSVDAQEGATTVTPDDVYTGLGGIPERFFDNWLCDPDYVPRTPVPCTSEQAVMPATIGVSPPLESDPAKNSDIGGDKDRDDSDDGGLSGGAIAGIVIAVLVVVAVAAILTVFYFMGAFNGKKTGDGDALDTISSSVDTNTEL